MTTFFAFLASLMLSTTSHDLMQIKINIQEPVVSCDMYVIVDDEYIPIHKPEIEGSQITIYIKEYKDYYLVINDQDVTLTANAYDVIDERDLSISMNGEYFFKKGVLQMVFSSYARK